LFILFEANFLANVNRNSLNYHTGSLAAAMLRCDVLLVGARSQSHRQGAVLYDGCTAVWSHDHVDLCSDD